MSQTKELSTHAATARDALAQLQEAQCLLGDVTGKLGLLPRCEKEQAQASRLCDQIKALWHDVNQVKGRIVERATALHRTEAED